MLLLLALFHTLKYVLVLPVLLRFSERFIDLVLVKVVMQAFALMRWQELFHKDDAEFDFVKAKTGKLFVSRSKHIDAGSHPTLLLANDTGILEHLWLINAFSPLFCATDID
mmetsp:Transcript_35605/g.46858  ORF Transcript_35605/g.46858 Transcript_35605/m.46858 type:complete len:111 (-) Transcript_35605:569-901(-)